MPDPTSVEVPETLEGWYVLHDMYAVDWPHWNAVPAEQRDAMARQLREWLEAAAANEGDSAAYSLISQKGDLLFLHYRSSPLELNRVELTLRQTAAFDFLRPAYSFLSVIELGMYELTTLARKKLADQGILPNSEVFEEFFETEMVKQHQRVRGRLFRSIPGERYICFYPMNKRRGEQVNWYALSIEQRRELMRGHGGVGHKYHKNVTQVIGGSVGLDDWEWGVSLHANDPLLFKKLVYEMRFDPASALYAEFGAFYVGVRVAPADLPDLLSGRIA